MKNAVTWFEIYVDNMDRARSFYERVLNTTLSKLPMGDEGEMWAFPWENDAPNASGALVKHPMGKPSASGTLVYFDSADCATELSRIEAAGGRVLQPKMPIGEFGFIGIASDTEGNTIGFHSMA